MNNDQTEKPAETIKAGVEELKDIGLGTKTLINRIVSVGIVGVFMSLFVVACYAGYQMLRDEVAANKEISRMFLDDLRRERDRQDAKWEINRDRSDTRHQQMMEAIKATQTSIQEAQRTMDRSITIIGSTVKGLDKVEKKINGK